MHRLVPFFGALGRKWCPELGCERGIYGAARAEFCARITSRAINSKEWGESIFHHPHSSAGAPIMRTRNQHTCRSFEPKIEISPNFQSSFRNGFITTLFPYIGFEGIQNTIQSTTDQSPVETLLIPASILVLHSTNACSLWSNKPHCRHSAVEHQRFKTSQWL